MTATRSTVKLTNAALDDRERPGDTPDSAPVQDIILRGVLDADSLSLLQVADYQREVLSTFTINKLAAAIKQGSGVPDVQLGMRGGQFSERAGAFYLEDPVYIIDGLQRRTAALSLMRKGVIPRLGAQVYFNTSERMERHMFRQLNVSRVRLSPSVLLHNECSENAALDMLSTLCKDSAFPLKGRVCWQQSMLRSQIMTAASLVKVAGLLHSGLGYGIGERRVHALQASTFLDILMHRIGRAQMRANVLTFFTALDEMFSVSAIVYKESAPQIRLGFLTTLARLYANHADFWHDAELVIPSYHRKKLATFAMQDPHVISLCASGEASQKILYVMLVNHINSGKKTRRLVEKNAPVRHADADLDDTETVDPLTCV